MFYIIQKRQVYFEKRPMHSKRDFKVTYFASSSKDRSVVQKVPTYLERGLYI